MPVAADAQQNSYSVPFPYAEQGSIYAVARLAGKTQAPSGDHALCSPGKVVTASVRTADSPVVTAGVRSVDTALKTVLAAVDSTLELVSRRVAQ